MTISLTSQRALSEALYKLFEPISKDDCEVLCDQVEVLKERLIQDQKNEEMDSSKFGENGPINAGVDSIHALMKYKRNEDDTDFCKKFFDNYRKELKQDIRYCVSLVA